MTDDTGGLFLPCLKIDVFGKLMKMIMDLPALLILDTQCLVGELCSFFCGQGLFSTNCTLKVR